MTALKFLVFSALLILASAVTAQQQQNGAAQAKFKGSIDLLDKVQAIASFAADGQSGTVIFRNLQAGISGQGGPLVATRSVTVSLPVEAQGKAVPVHQVVRGFVKTSPGTRAALLVHSGDHTTALDLQQPKAEGDDFVQAIDASVPAGASEQITFFLLVERDVAAADSGALLTIDSVDVVLGKA
jgi:hypothetical protein